jgi:hypothetical protein
VRKTAISCAIAVVMLTVTAAAHAGGYISMSDNAKDQAGNAAYCRGLLSVR